LPAELGDVLDLVFVDPTTAGTIDGVVAVLREEALRHDRPFVFGHSAQGLLAMAYAAAYPVRGLIAVGTPPRMPLPIEVLQKHWAEEAEPERKARLEAQPDRFDALTRWHDLDFDPAPIDALAADVGDWAMQVNVRASSEHDWDAARRAITAPVLLVLGGTDFLVPPVLWRDDDLASFAGDVTVRVLERSGHQPFFDEPDAFVEAITTFVGG
jgi:pimeloyl-ACP methyl ester carboxylesterase